MSSITHNQRCAYVSQALTAGKHLALALKNVSPAERAAILATIVAATATPLDLVMLAEPGEAREAASVVDGVLARSLSDPHGYSLGGNHLFSIVELRKEPSYA